MMLFHGKWLIHPLASFRAESIDRNPSHRAPPPDSVHRSDDNYTSARHTGELALFLRLKCHLNAIGLWSTKGPVPLAGEIMTLTRCQDSIPPTFSSNNQGGYFTHAHNFKVENPTFLNNNNNSPTYNSYFVNVQPGMPRTRCLEVQQTLMPTISS
jgi:hypothetical protein